MKTKEKPLADSRRFASIRGQLIFPLPEAQSTRSLRVVNHAYNAKFENSNSQIPVCPIRAIGVIRGQTRCASFLAFQARNELEHRKAWLLVGF
ncbi:hypothetical protein [Rosistilla ulvae]|uniref:hypothetical protein n=1 Tax=Rosistilla ulvae TaxID=1930277 RepID=UPI0011A7CBF8|nr:hypothetical protein [Rosistilla ulvae]